MSTANEGEALRDITPWGDFRYALLCGALISYRIAGQYIAPRKRHIAKLLQFRRCLQGRFVNRPYGFYGG